MLRKIGLRMSPNWFLRITASPFSSVPLKEKLMKKLKDIRGGNNAHKLCEELILSKNIYENSLSLPSRSWLEVEKDAVSDIIFIRDILSREEPEYTMANEIWKVIHHESSDSGKSEVMSLIANIKTFSVPYITGELDSKEFFTQIVDGMENIISSCDEDSLYYRYSKIYPPGGLNLLNFVLLQNTIVKADELLEIVFQICLARLHFCEEEKKVIGTLLTETIEPVYYSILSMDDDNDLQSSWLKKRSSLQFYKDVFAKFPTDYETPLENFYMDKVDKSINMLDDLITTWCDFISTCIDKGSWRGAYFSKLDVDTDLEKDGASLVPNSHSWWIKCSSLLNKLDELEIPADFKLRF